MELSPSHAQGKLSMVIFRLGLLGAGMDQTFSSMKVEQTQLGLAR